jgi:lysozyme
MSTEPQGIDVAYPQGPHYNWKQWKGKISFGMCKVTEGLTITDPDFVNNWNGMWELNRMMPRFGYHFFHAADDPAEQAARLVSAVRAHGLLPGDNLVLDLEPTRTDGSNDGVAAATVAQRARTCLNHANSLAPGHRVLVYTNPSFAGTGACAGLSPWFLWVAHYGVSAPAVPRPWSTWTFWQYSDTPVDTDRFHGTEAQLLTFTRMPKTR